VVGGVVGLLVMAEGVVGIVFLGVVGVATGGKHHCSSVGAGGSMGVRFDSAGGGMGVVVEGGVGRCERWLSGCLSERLWPFDLWFPLFPSNLWLGALSLRRGRCSKTSFAARGLYLGLCLLLCCRCDLVVKGSSGARGGLRWLLLVCDIVDLELLATLLRGYCYGALVHVLLDCGALAFVVTRLSFG
jgi:hypothetical protein